MFYTLNENFKCCNRVILQSIWVNVILDENTHFKTKTGALKITKYIYNFWKQKQNIHLKSLRIIHEKYLKF